MNMLQIFFPCSLEVAIIKNLVKISVAIACTCKYTQQTDFKNTNQINYVLSTILKFFPN